MEKYVIKNGNEYFYHRNDLADMHGLGSKDEYTKFYETKDNAWSDFNKYMNQEVWDDSPIYCRSHEAIYEVYVKDKTLELFATIDLVTT